VRLFYNSTQGQIYSVQELSWKLELRSVVTLHTRFSSVWVNMVSLKLFGYLTLWSQKSTTVDVPCVAEKNEHW